MSVTLLTIGVRRYWQKVWGCADLKVAGIEPYNRDERGR
jgi:hypothetical protein